MSILIAKIIGIYYLTAGFGMLLNPKSFRKMIEEYEKSVAISFLGGIMALGIGLLIVLNHNTWTKDWTTLVTLVGWLAVIKGFLFTAFPQIMGKFKGSFKNPQPWGALVIALGLIFSYYGFM